MTLVYAPQAWVASPWQLLVLQFLVGLAGSTLLVSLVALIGLNQPGSQAGAAFGLDNSVGAVGRAAGAMIGTAVAGAWGASRVFLLATCVYLLVLLLALPRSRPR